MLAVPALLPQRFPGSPTSRRTLRQCRLERREHCQLCHAPNERNNSWQTKRQAPNAAKSRSSSARGGDVSRIVLQGLGDIEARLSTDVPTEELSSWRGERDALFVSRPMRPTEDRRSIFTNASSWCYCTNGCVDALELCGGECVTSQLAFKRGLSSGGNLDKYANVDLGGPRGQTAVFRYLDARQVSGVIQRLNCRSSGQPSYFNSTVIVIICRTWEASPRRRLAPRRLSWRGCLPARRLEPMLRTETTSADMGRLLAPLRRAS